MRVITRSLYLCVMYRSAPTLATLSNWLLENTLECGKEKNVLTICITIAWWLHQDGLSSRYLCTFCNYEFVKLGAIFVSYYAINLFLLYFISIFIRFVSIEFIFRVKYRAPGDIINFRPATTIDRHECLWGCCLPSKLDKIFSISFCFYRIKTSPMYTSKGYF